MVVDIMIAGFHLQAQANTIQRGNVRLYFLFIKQFCIDFTDREKRVFTNAAGINAFDNILLPLIAFMLYPLHNPHLLPMLVAKLQDVLVISSQKVSFGSTLIQ